MLPRIVFLLAALLLTLLTQIGGAILLLTWLVCRFIPPEAQRGWRRRAALPGLFVLLYAALSATVVPWLAALGGRVPLPCWRGAGDRLGPASLLFCALNRHYVAPRLARLATELSTHMDRAYNGTTTLFLDASFPFFDGFPLLPHLSHDDGRKLDLAFHYASPAGSYLPGRLRSPIGYWAFERPGPADPAPCPEQGWRSLRWDLRALQPLYPDRPLEPERTRAALRWLVSEGRRLGVEKVFIEPYLAKRLGVSSPRLRFQGCAAARHDDHVHVEIGP